jgi:hypothetical protein
MQRGGCTSYFILDRAPRGNDSGFWHLRAWLASATDEPATNVLAAAFPVAWPNGAP